MTLQYTFTRVLGNDQCMPVASLKCRDETDIKFERCIEVSDLFKWLQWSVIRCDRALDCATDFPSERYGQLLANHRKISSKSSLRLCHVRRRLKRLQHRREVP